MDVTGLEAPKKAEKVRINPPTAAAARGQRQHVRLNCSERKTLKSESVLLNLDPFRTEGLGAQLLHISLETFLSGWIIYSIIVSFNY